MNPQVVVQFEFDALVRLKNRFLHACAVLRPIVVFHRRKIKIGEVGIRRVIWLDFGDIQTFPGSNDLGNEPPKRCLLGISGGIAP